MFYSFIEFFQKNERLFYPMKGRFLPRKSFFLFGLCVKISEKKGLLKSECSALFKNFRCSLFLMGN